MGRRPCCSKVGLNKGAWTKLEDKILTDYIKLHGEGNWNNLPKLAGLKRCGKSCRLRWVNYLRPDIKRGNISQDEEDLIIRMHKLIGNRWSLIAGRLPGRTDNEIKNYWNTTLRKKLEPTRTKVASSRKIAKENGPKPESEPKNIVKSSQHVKPIRTKAFRFTSNIQTAMPTNFQFSSGADEECNGSNEELTTNHHSPIDENPSLEAANLMIDSCDCDDHDPQMNHNTIETFNHDHTYSPPMVDDQGLQEWIIRSNPNFNLYTSIFEDDLGVLDFDSLGTLLDFGQEWS